MKICLKKRAPNEFPKLINGNLYRAGDNGEIYICTSAHTLVNVRSGANFADNGAFGRVWKQEQKRWEDVTDKFCLQEI